MKLRITKDGTIHRGEPKAAGEIVTEEDKNHAGGLMCAGAVPVKDGEGQPEPKPDPAPEPGEKPAPPKKKAAKKKAAPKKSDD